MTMTGQEVAERRHAMLNAFMVEHLPGAVDLGGPVNFGSHYGGGTDDCAFLWNAFADNTPGFHVHIYRLIDGDLTDTITKLYCHPNQSCIRMDADLGKYIAHLKELHASGERYDKSVRHDEWCSGRRPWMQERDYW